MGHLTRTNYRLLQERMDRSIPGIFDSESLYEILRILFSDEEARLCSLMPLTHFRLERMADIWGMSDEEAQEKLDALGSKGLVYRQEVDGQSQYLLSPPVLGFFEFSLMRTDGKFDGKRLSELYHRYINVEEGFARTYAEVDPPVSRVFVQEDAIETITSEVLPYERAREGIDQATCITTGICFCRHKMEHMGMACDNPQEVCLTFNDVAKHLAEQGIAREITKKEAHSILDLCIERGLVQIGDNKAGKLIVICNCCSCCCDLLGIYKRFGTTGLISPSNYLATVDPAACSNCGVCVKRCPVEAIETTQDRPLIKTDRCLGCGVCTRFCPTGACTLTPRQERPYVPANTFEKVALQAIDRGKVGNFLFDDFRKRRHRVLARLINALVRLPPVRRLLLSEPVKKRLFSYLAGRSRFRVSTNSPPPPQA